MARWATFCEIAGVSFTGCRVEILDGDPFLDTHAGSVEWGNDGTPHVQTLDRGVRGIQFGLRMLTAEASKIQAVCAAIQGAPTFTVYIDDGMYSVAVNGVKDWSQKWLTHGPHSEGWYDDVVWRFVAHSQI